MTDPRMDNTPAHRSDLTQGYLRQVQWPVMKHSPPPTPYSPDLSPADFLLFPRLKRKMRGCTIERPVYGISNQRRQGDYSIRAGGKDLNNLHASLDHLL